MNAANRYPGLSSFQPDQKHLFFGRDREARELYHLISVEKTVVLFSKSGIGKTSLLNAGVIPDLEAGGIVPVPVRFGTDAYRPEQHCSIAVDEAWQRFSGEAQPRGRDTSAQESLWEQLKRTNFEREGRKYVPLLIFDQFEELFTLFTRPEQRLRIAVELADLIQERLPATLRESLLERMDRGEITPAELAAAERAPELKFVFSIRSDMLHFMDELSEQIPYILRSRYQLFGLSEAQARDAIERPAALEGAGFATAPFAYSREALQEILKKLSKNAEVESFQLQSICQALEEKIAGGALPPSGRITPDFYGGIAGLDAIIEESYTRRLEALDPADYLPARRLLEDALINENERRRSVDVTDLLARPGVTQALLDRLEAMRLLRREPRLDSYYYEISHDTLLVPILKFRKEWLEEEAQRKLTEKAEQQKAEQEKITRRKKINFWLGLGAFLLLTWALFQTNDARKESQNAELASKRADSLLTVANDAITESQKQADTAKVKTLIADAKDQEAKVAIAKAEFEQKKSAEAMAKLKNEKIKLVEIYLTQASDLIYHLEYENAFEPIQKAIDLEVAQKPISDALLEFAFWYAETNHPDRAWGVLETAYTLAGRSLKRQGNDRTATLGAIGALNPARLDFLNARYYPVMVKISGGTDTIGGIIGWDGDSILPFIITVNSYLLAETETTWWQYNLYCAASGTDAPQKETGWGGEGDNPVNNVNWYDAFAYAQWLSDRQGHKQALSGNSNETYAVDLQAPGYRLPTEVEWEYAARSATASTYAGCNKEEALYQYAWYSANSGGRTRPVKGIKPNAYKPNDWGLYGMSGNVWEWCWDWHGDYPADSRVNYKGPDTGAYRVLRGGSWNFDPVFCRVANRYSDDPDDRGYNLGFRLARTN